VTRLAPMGRPTRIALVSEHASPAALLGSADAGGQNVYVDQVSRNLGQLGYEVDVFTRRDNLRTPEVVEWAPGVRLVNLKAGPARFMFKDDLWPLMPQLRDALLRFMVRDGTRYDLIHGNFWMSGWVASELGRRLGVPVVQIFHGMGKTKQRHQGAADSSPADRVDVEREVIRSVDRLIAQCPSEKAELVYDYGADPRRVVVIPSAVDTRLFRPVARDKARRRIGLGTDSPVVVSVGRILPRKDVRTVLRAVALLAQQVSPPVHLLLVGGETVEPDPIATPEIGELQRLVAELGVQDLVHFVGKRQPDVLRDYYGAGDVVVTVPWYEPFGLTPLEAMACSRPVIGSAVGGITYTILDGVTGCLVSPRDPAALAACLRRLLADPERRAAMGRAGRARVECDFTWQIVARRTAAIYESQLVRQAEPELLAQAEQLVLTSSKD
jgi:D-inositol-3-phosphate glycosyltransferase